MADTTTIAVSALAGVALGLYAFRLFSSRRWPELQAELTEVPPQSMFERDGNRFYFNTDSDHMLVYRVNGKEYRHIVNDKANTTIGGIKVWRKPPEAGKKTIRYHPASPDSYVDPADDSPIKIALSILASIGCLGIALWNIIGTS